MAYFRQLASATSDRYAYLLADMDKRQAVIIDPAADQVMLYLSLLTEIRVRLVRILLTQSRSEMLRGVEKLVAGTQAKVSAAANPGLALIDAPLADGDLVDFGDELIRTRLTPGHTRGATCYVWRDRVFTGDTLLIDQCDATDCADGDPGTLFDTLTQRLLTLPDETLVYPARDLDGRQVSCIGEQRRRNSSLAGVTRDEFIAAQERRRALHGHDHKISPRRTAP